VAGLLVGSRPDLEVELVVVETLGDRALDRPIWELGGTGVFVTEVQSAVVAGRADVAVHSAKDLPSSPELATPGLTIGAVPRRSDPRDALVGRALADIPPGGTVATGATRRRAQLADLRPDLTFTGLRGNVDTRLRRAGPSTTVVVALAALERLGRTDVVAEVLDPTDVVPQVGQGALAVECRSDDDAVLGLVASIEHKPSRRAVEAERAFLGALGGGCELPAGAHAVARPAGMMHLRVVLATLDGHLVLRDEAEGDDPSVLGTELAHRLLEDGGGRQLLDDLGAVTLAS
jgi:hydroxymethylbilane synthase